jgi:hypothetical protein
MKRVTIFSVLLVIMLSGCDDCPKSGRGFTLPDGDMDRGRAVIVERGVTPATLLVMLNS